MNARDKEQREGGRAEEDVTPPIWDKRRSKSFLKIAKVVYV